MIVTVIRAVQLGTVRTSSEGPRIGTVRRPPRAVRSTDFARRNFFDAWLPELAPSAPLISWALSKPFTDRRWATFARKYQAEMRKPSAQRLIGLLAVLSKQANFSIGCYCQNETRCHRILLMELLIAHGAIVA
jgi:uncharacterized protein YeaO (DUF488 family)